MKIAYFISVLLLLAGGSPLFAAHQELLYVDLYGDADPEAATAYRRYKEVDDLNIKVPTVVEIPFDKEFLEYFSFAILDKTTNLFEPYFFRQDTFDVPLSVTVSSDGGVDRNMSDDNVQTYTQFELTEDNQGKVEIILRSDEKITSSALTLLLDNHVALPNSVKITARTQNGEGTIVLAQRKMDGLTVRFPKTTSDKWTITFVYGQPLRISELRLLQEDTKMEKSRFLRFLAQPGHAYRIYFDSDRWSLPPVGESANLSVDKDVLRIFAGLPQDNPAYKIADVDNDGVPDVRDNCVFINNLDQIDLNANGRGDVCDDFDKDGVINKDDNCPNLPNFDQRDVDGDKIGDVCDGEESRLTERYKWIPWAGIGFAALVLIVLFAYTASSTFTQNKNRD